VVSEFIKYYGIDGNGTDSVLGTVTVNPEQRAPDVVRFDKSFGPVASVYKLKQVPDSLLARTVNPLSIIEDSYVGSFGWDGFDQNWGANGPLGQSDDFVVRQVRPFVAPVSGTYRFRVTSDDGSWLWVDGRLVVSNVGLHSATSSEGAVYLIAGTHTLSVKFFENMGEAYSAYAWMPPSAAGFASVPRPASAAHVGPHFGVGEQLLLAADDLGGSGLNLLRYWIDGGNEQQSLSGRIPISLSAGTHTVEYQAEDLEGNWSGRASVAFTVDPNLRIRRTFLPQISD
jgi:hypothetical protein